MKSHTYILSLLVCLSMTCCQSGPTGWTYVQTLDLGGTTPIGLAAIDDKLWIADGDNNQLVQVTTDGKILTTKEGFERPMHITSDGTTVYVPEYGTDQITLFDGKDRSMLPLADSLDAPAGIHLANGLIAIADFYNHRILLGKDTDWISIGKEGKADGEFYYPTDVHIAHQKIYVADAYNNRVQVFDLDGHHLQTIGKEQKMNAATGIYVSSSQICITDFEHDRVLIFDLEGKLVQEITEGLEKPTDVLLNKGLLYIANYKGKNLMTYQIPE